MNERIQELIDRCRMQAALLDAALGDLTRELATSTPVPPTEETLPEGASPLANKIVVETMGGGRFEVDDDDG